MKGERGFALVITMVVAALLVALVAEFVNEVFVDTSLRHSYVAGQQASIMAESGVTGGLQLLQFELAKNKGYSSLHDSWAKPLQIGDEQGTLEVRIEDESAKLNLNYLVPPAGDFSSNPFYYEVAVRLMKKLGLAPDMLDAAADWLDTNDEPHPGGAESSYYKTLKTPYAAKNGPFETVEELAMVKGFAGKPLEQLLPYVTVYADMPAAPVAPININTASREILLALDDRMTDDLVQRLLDYRATTPFKNSAELARVAGLENIAIGLSTTRITVKSSVYRIRSRANVRDTSRLIEAVVRFSGTQPTLLYWREY